MNRRAVGGLLTSIAVLTVAAMAWQHHAHAPERTQQSFAQLIKDIGPHLKTNSVRRPNVIPSTINELLDTTKEIIKGDDNDADDPEHAAEYAATLRSKKDILEQFQPRFSAINPRHLKTCQREDLYRYWGSLDIWHAWTDTELALSAEPDNAALNYAKGSERNMGRPAEMAEIKAIGDEEFAAVTALLTELEERVQTELNLDLHSFSQDPKHYSLTETDIERRASKTLERVEAEFEASGDFDFSPVPKAHVQIRRGYGPYNSIASYRKQDNAMVLYWADENYDHKYDTMLAVHEIMPGHHLQLKTVKNPACGKGPVYARTAFLEGWATYAETLANDLGLFEAPDQRLGWLDYRLIRAMRIRLDTARIDSALTDAQAQARWEADMPQRLHALFDREWARITQSSHHLSYIFGVTAIMDAKNKLRAKLGLKFDEKEFHRALLNSSHQHLLYLPERMAAHMQANDAAAQDTENTR